MQIAGKHALITGGAKRLGRAIAESLLERGAKVTVHYHSSHAEKEAFLLAMQNHGRSFHSVRANLSSVPEIELAVADAISHHGPVDILINSASLFYPKPALATEVADWDAMLDVNLKGQFFFAKFCAAQMQAQLGSGVIINIADTAATNGVKNFSAYLCSKAGLLMMTKALAKEWAPSIRVNAISPGPVLEPEHYSAAQSANSANRTLLKRWGKPTDVTEAVRFLIGNDYITGIDLKIDGGRSLVG